MFEVCDLIFDRQFLAFQVLEDRVVRQGPVFFQFDRRFQLCVSFVKRFDLLDFAHRILLLGSKRYP